MAIDPRRAWREAAALVREHRARLSAGLGILVVNRASSLALPAALGVLVDDIAGKHRTDLIWPLALGILAAGVVQAISGYGLSQLLGVAGQRAITSLRQRVHDHVLRLPITRFDSSQSGTLVSRVMTDAEGIRNLVGTGIVHLVGGIITASVVLGILCWLNWRLTLGIVVLLIIFGAVLAKTFSSMRPLFRQRNKLQGEISGSLGQVLAGMRTVKIFTAEERLKASFAKDTDRLFDLVRQTLTGFSWSGAVTLVVLALVGALVVVLGGHDLVEGRMTTRDLVQYIAFTMLLAAPIGQLASIGTQMTEAFAGLDRIRDLLASPVERADGTPCPVLQGRVTFTNVGFAYDAGRPVLHDISLTVEPGKTVALVGPSGSGKTTLVSLVLALAQPTDGLIHVDDLDLGHLDLTSYRRQLGVVLQDNWLLDASVADNLRFSRPDATDAQVQEALQAASADGFVAALPEGLNTLVGERGVKLSGGQRQRLAIARALLADPRILVLDEATSALDSESEAEIQGALARLRAGRTTFVIAHRLSTIRHADEILVLDQGRIVERGTHTALLATAGLYRRLHDRQHAVEADRHVNPGEELKA